MDKFYTAKIDALMSERRSHADAIKELIEDVENGDMSPVTVRNIIGHATELLHITSEIDAYKMSKQMYDLFTGGSK